MASEDFDTFAESIGLDWWTAVTFEDSAESIAAISELVDCDVVVDYKLNPPLMRVCYADAKEPLMVAVGEMVARSQSGEIKVLRPCIDEVC